MSGPSPEPVHPKRSVPLKSLAERPSRCFDSWFRIQSLGNVMTFLPPGARYGVLLVGAVLFAGCAVPVQTVQLGGVPPASAADSTLAGSGTEHMPAAPASSATAADAPPSQLVVMPAVIPSDGVGLVRIRAPGADSVALESVNGVERYGTRGSALAVRISGRFADTTSDVRYATRARGRLFDVVHQPVKITTCRERRCREYYETLTFQLPERNERSVALTAGWVTAFARRAVTAQDRSVLLRQAINNSLWSLQAEVATHGFNARLQGYYNADEQGGSLDLSHMFKHVPADRLGYGLALHVATRQIDWLQEETGVGGQGLMSYQASAGPSIMLKGLTASSQLGFYTDGRETLQVLSTYISFNGALTEVRNPVSFTVEKTLAFGGSGVVPRRRDGTDRLTMGVQLTPGVALRFGLNTRHSTWPVAGSNDNIQASEVYYTLGAQYTLSW